MKKMYLSFLSLAVLAALLFLPHPQSVQAISVQPPQTPAAGSWVWADADVTGTIVPQYTLAGATADDYAVLQSAGIQVSGATQICHPYPGGKIGWTAEIRMLTAGGWQAVPTVNQWVPDEEGAFMTCAQAGSAGTYAVFGYWEKPEGWMEVAVCVPELPAGEWEYVAPVSQLHILFPSPPSPFSAANAPFHCSYLMDGWVMTDDGFIHYNTMYYIGHYCTCEDLYRPVVSGAQ
ncbi:MAG: hypothetical protein HPY85_15425 [Anaerolineae bacterium]|nr:hypothetical protein [Anaerolineae bacterium]